MSDNTLDEQKTTDENADNLAQNDEMMEAALAKELNTDDNRAGGGQQLEDDDTETEIENLKAAVAEANDKYIRLVAEFENAKKRNAKERIDLIQTAGRDIVQSLLEILDDSERAEKQLETATDIPAIKEGISLVFNKLRHTMQQKGVRAMESLNQSFNADIHEAITEIPAPSEDMKGKVLAVIEPGYYLNDKLIRFAKVVVGN